MLGGRIRNGKPRILVFCFVGIVILLGIYVLRDTHLKLNDARSSFEHCEQQQESLSAQLQVVYEHKSRLEKSLQQEKSLHKKTKDEILAQYQELQDVKEKEKQEAGNRFNSIQQQHKMLQIQNEDLQEELNKVQQSNIKLMNDKQKLQDSLDENEEVMKQKDMNSGTLKAKIVAMQQEIESLTKDMSDKDSKLKELAMHVNLCDAKLDSLRLDKLPVKPETEALRTEKGNNIVDGEHKLLPKEVALGQVEENQLPGKLENPKDRVLKIGRFNNGKELLHDAKALTSQNENTEDKFPKKSEEYNQIKNHVHGGPIAIPMGMGKRTGSLGNPVHQFDLPNNVPPPEESLDAAQQLAVPDTRNLNQKSYEHDDGGAKIPVGRVEEFQGNGLEQQEIGGDQDLDNMEEDGAGGQPPKDDKEEGKSFIDADFDQGADEDRDTIKKAEPKSEGVVLAPI